jgi:molybdate transport system substrate-binding protein
MPALSLRPARPPLALALALALAGCRKEAPSSSAAPAPTPATAPELARPVELVVYAATSTRAALQAFERPYESAHGVDLVFNFGSSGDLSKQIVVAAKADVFLSADEKEMDAVEAAGLVANGTRRRLLSNQLVVVEPADGPSVFSEPFEPSQLASPAVELLSLGNVETVPAGRYAKACVRLPNPFSVTTSRSVSSRAMSIAST